MVGTQPRWGEVRELQDSRPPQLGLTPLPLVPEPVQWEFGHTPWPAASQSALEAMHLEAIR